MKPRINVWLLLASLVLGGCATGPYVHPSDPLEPLNRKIYGFNEKLDEAVAKPVATAYRDVVPGPIRAGVSNFFANLGDLWSSLNASLQLKGEEAGTDFMRFAVNSSLGFYGVLDVASEMRMQRTTHTLGETLGVWGVPSGPYLMFPFFGPSTVRNASAAIVSSAVVDSSQQVNWLNLSEGATPLAMLNIEHLPTRSQLGLLGTVNQRARLLEASDMLGGLALDPYAFVRDAYLQRHNHKMTSEK